MCKSSISRTYDPTYLSKASSNLSYDVVGLNPDKLTGDLFNITLVNSDGDVTLFEYVSEGLYEGHYFLMSRGPKALRVCKDMLEKIFSDEYNVFAIIGYTPSDNKGALRMNKALGFVEGLTLNRGVGDETFFSLTKEQYIEAKGASN